MKGYKAFGKGFVCKGKQYAENTIFEEDSAVICKTGMHFCKNPLDVLDYYPLIDDNGNLTEFAEVEALEEPQTDDNKKYCTKKLKIGTKITFGKFINASFEFIKESCKNDKEVEGEKICRKKDYSQVATSGDSSKVATSGVSSQVATSGVSSQVATSGDYSQVATSGDSSKVATSGVSSQVATSGDSSKVATSGDYSKVATSGKNSVVMCAGGNSVARAKIGSWITLSEWKWIGNDYVPICVKTEKVDGEKIKEDTFYKLINGTFKEV